MKQILHHTKIASRLGAFWLTLALVTLIGVKGWGATITSTATGGNWSVGATWVGGITPGSGDDVVIAIGATVTMDVNATCNSLSTGTTQGTATLDGTSVLTTGTVNINSGKNNIVYLRIGSSSGSSTTLICSSIAVSSGGGSSGEHITVFGTLKNSGTTATLSSFTCNSGSTVEFNGSNQTIYPTNYSNLTLSGSGTKTLTTNTSSITGNLSLMGNVIVTTVLGLTVGGNLTIETGATFITGSNFTLSITGNTLITGTLTLGGTSTKTFTGNVSINSGGNWNEIAIAAINFAGNLQNDGSFTANTGVHTFSGTGKTISGNNAIAIPRLTISGTTTNNGTLTVATTLAGTSVLTNGTNATLNFGGSSITPNLTATATGNTVNYYGAAQTVKVTQYYNLTLSGSGAKTIGTAASGILASGILNIDHTSGGTATASVTNTNVSVGQLRFSGVTQIAGTWGSTASAATNQNNTWFTSVVSGYLNAGGALDHFAISSISSPQTAGTAITGITLTAQDVNNITVTSFVGTVTYSGTAGITGTSVAFTAGQLSGVSVTPILAGTGKTFIVTGSTKTGTSTFDVNPGALDHFTISTITSPQTAGIAITGITITAQDANNNTLDAGPHVFTGTVVYGGTAGITGTSSAFAAGQLTGVSVTPVSPGTGMTFIVTASGKTGTSTFDVITKYQTRASGDWNASGTWSYWDGTTWINATSTTPASADQEIFVLSGHELTVTANVTVDQLTVEAGGMLTVNSGVTLTVADGSGTDLLLKSSSATSNASLWVKPSGSVNGTGSISYNRWMKDDDWMMISSPLSGQAMDAAWLTANSIFSPDGNSEQWEITDYRESTDSWYYLEGSLPSTFADGKGYGLRRDGAGTVAFTGSPLLTDQNVTVTRSMYGWNLVGNPYTSAIRATGPTGSTNFIGYNYQTNLDPSYSALYLWDEIGAYDQPGDANYFVVVCNNGFDPPAHPSLPQSTQSLQVGQGFFVKAKSEATEVLFDTDMQLHSTASELKSAEVSWPGIQLIATSTNGIASTIVGYNPEMTTGLDPSFDVGLFNQVNDIELYTKLVQDNGVKFALQALPDNNLENMVIPVGIICKSGGKVTFSGGIVPLSNGYRFFLEDRITGKLTDLSAENYTVELPAYISGTGRFFLHTSLTTGVNDMNKNGEELKLRLWSNGNIVTIDGEVSARATATVFDVTGRKLGNYPLTGGNRNSFALPAASKGIFLVQVVDGIRIAREKITVAN